MNIFVAIAASAMQTAGVILKNKDTNTTGSDDVAGNLLSVGSQALSSYAAGDEQGFRKYLKLIADAINNFLALE
jgi:hypothetical protein